MKMIKDRIDFLEQILDYSYHYDNIEDLRKFLNGHLKQLKKIRFDEHYDEVKNNEM